MLHEGTGCEPFDDSICEIPLYAKDGSLRALTRVDPDDWFRFARYPWHLLSTGYVIGRMTTKGYRREKQRGQRVGGPAKQVLMHRLVMGMDPDDRRKVDHINRDRLDNRRANLRIVNNSEHSQNQTWQRGRTSKYRGVHWDRTNRKWVAKAQLNGRVFSLGHYNDELLAAEAAAEFRRLYMPCSAEGTAA
jgi:hypothetical protein